MVFSMDRAVVGRSSHNANRFTVIDGCMISI